jgi:hypothetical protein
MLERMPQLLLPRIYGRVPRDEAEAPLPGGCDARRRPTGSQPKMLPSRKSSSMPR